MDQGFHIEGVLVFLWCIKQEHNELDIVAYLSYAFFVSSYAYVFPVYFTVRMLYWPFYAMGVFSFLGVLPNMGCWAVFLEVCVAYHMWWLNFVYQFVILFVTIDHMLQDLREILTSHFNSKPKDIKYMNYFLHISNIYFILYDKIKLTLNFWTNR